MNAIERLESLTVGDVMTAMVVQVQAGQPMSEVARTMQKHHVSLVPVVNEHGRAVGVLSAYDFVVRAAHGATNGAASLAGPSAASADAPPEERAEEHMTRGIRSVQEETSVLEAARILFCEHLHRLLVLDEQGRPRGVVSTMDVISALINSVEEMEAQGARPW